MSHRREFWVSNEKYFFVSLGAISVSLVHDSLTILSQGLWWYQNQMIYFKRLCKLWNISRKLSQIIQSKKNYNFIYHISLIVAFRIFSIMQIITRYISIYYLFYFYIFWLWLRLQPLQHPYDIVYQKVIVNFYPKIAHSDRTIDTC